MSVKTKEADTTRIHVVVTRELKETLKKLAKADGRSVSGLANLVLTKYAETELKKGK